MGHLVVNGALAQLEVKAGQLKVQPLRDSQMQGIDSARPQQQRVSGQFVGAEQARQQPVWKEDIAISPNSYILNLHIMYRLR